MRQAERVPDLVHHRLLDEFADQFLRPLGSGGDCVPLAVTLALVFTVIIGLDAGFSVTFGFDVVFVVCFFS